MTVILNFIGFVVLVFAGRKFAYILESSNIRGMKKRWVWGILCIASLFVGASFFSSFVLRTGLIVFGMLCGMIFFELSRKMIESMKTI